MRRVRVRVSAKPRLRQAESADAPTVSRKVARVWFPESQEPATRKSAS